MVFRMFSRKSPAVRIVDDAVVGVKGDHVRVRIPRALLRRVDMYKIDHITVDLVCCDIVFGQGDSLFTSTFHEELEGWDDLLAWLETLPGFRSDWRSAVIQPPFAENRTTVFTPA